MAQFTQLFTLSTTTTTVEAPLGIHLGTFLGGGAGTYSSINAHWTGVISAFNRTPAVLAAVMINSYLDAPAPPSTWGGDVFTWQSASIPVNGSVAPLLTGHFTDGSTTDQDYAGAIAGTYDTALTNALAKWKGIGITKMYFRINWEFNANFRGWAPAQNQVGNFVAAHKRWANVMHTWGNNNGVTVRMVWSPDTSYSSAEAETFSLPVINYFPVPDSNAVNGRYIDVIGSDNYMNGYGVSSNFGQGFTTALSTNTIWSLGTFAKMAQTYNCNLGISETGDGGTGFDQGNSPTNGVMAGWFTYLNTLASLSPVVPVEYIAVFDVNAGGALQFTNGGSIAEQNGWRCGLGIGGTQPSSSFTIPTLMTVSSI